MLEMFIVWHLQFDHKVVQGSVPIKSEGALIKEYESYRLQKISKGNGTK